MRSDSAESIAQTRTLDRAGSGDEQLRIEVDRLLWPATPTRCRGWKPGLPVIGGFDVYLNVRPRGQ